MMTVNIAIPIDVLLHVPIVNHIHETLGGCAEPFFAGHERLFRPFLILYVGARAEPLDDPTFVVANLRRAS